MCSFELSEAITGIIVMWNPSTPAIHAFEHLLNDRHFDCRLLVILGQFVVESIEQSLGITDQRYIRIKNFPAIGPENGR